MIRRSTRISAAIAALSLSLVPVSIAQAKQHCHPKGAHTLASNSYARVYGKGNGAFVCVKSSGKTTALQNATPNGDHFALGGKFVGWSSTDPTDPTAPAHSVVTVMHIPNHLVDSYWYPFQTNETIDKIVVASDGAAAWSMTPPSGGSGDYTQVQGTDRMHHPPDQFSDDHADMFGSSLHLQGKTVTWKYVDGTSGSQALF